MNSMMQRFFATLAILLVTGIAHAEPVKVLMETSKGNITLELDADKAPNTINNFLVYVDEGFYEGTIFHRVIKDFMIQGGGFTQDFKKKPVHDAIENEGFNGLKNDRGTISMARTGHPHSATAQFFINHKDNKFLNGDEASYKWGYAVFGKVTDGMDVVDAIAATKTGKGGPFPKDVPVESVVITKISRVAD